MTTETNSGWFCRGVQSRSGQPSATWALGMVTPRPVAVFTLNARKLRTEFPTDKATGLVQTEYVATDTFGILALIHPLQGLIGASMG